MAGCLPVNAGSIPAERAMRVEVEWQTPRLVSEFGAGSSPAARARSCSASRSALRVFVPLEFGELNARLVSGRTRVQLPPAAPDYEPRERERQRARLVSARFRFEPGARPQKV